MSANVTISCDGHGCNNVIDNNGFSDDVQQLIEYHHWHNDPTTDEFHYCDFCWTTVKTEYDEVARDKELDNA